MASVARKALTRKSYFPAVFVQFTGAFVFLATSVVFSIDAAAQSNVYGSNEQSARKFNIQMGFGSNENELASELLDQIGVGGYLDAIGSGTGDFGKGASFIYNQVIEPQREVKVDTLKRAWIIDVSNTNFDQTEATGLKLSSNTDESIWGCGATEPGVECLVRVPGQLEVEFSDLEFSETFFFLGAWDEENCWILDGCDRRNSDGSFGPFSGQVFSLNGNIHFSGRCLDEAGVSQFMCWGTPAGSPNWNPCFQDRVAAKVYLVPQTVFYSGFNPNGAQRYMQEYGVGAEFWANTDTLSITDLTNVWPDEAGANLFGTEPDLTAKFSEFDYPCPDKPSGGAVSGGGMVVDTKSSTVSFSNFNEDAEAKRCQDDPSTICYGDTAAPPTSCLFADPKQCEGGGVAANFLGSNSGDDIDEESEKASGRAWEFRSTIALISPATEVFCSGVLVHDRYLLTAAHCKCDFGHLISHAFVGNKIGKTDEERSAFGGHVFPLRGDPKNKDLLFEAGYCEASREERQEMSDLALWEFGNDLPLATKYKSVFYFQRDPVIGPPGVIVGFGTSEVEPKGGTKRFAIDIKLEHCNSADAEHYNSGCSETYDYVSINDETNRVDACTRDSGGPVYDIEGFFIGLIRGGIKASGGRLQTDCGYGGKYSKMGLNIASSGGRPFPDWYLGVLRN